MNKKFDRLIDCSMCPNMCKFSCPVYLATGDETFTPQKKARLILYKEKGFLENEKGFFDTMFQCALCGSCVVNCQYDDFDIRDFIVDERANAFKNGFIPETYKEILSNFKEFGNPDGKRDIINKGNGEIGFFVSCNTLKDKNVLSATEKIFKKANIDVQEFGGGDICCGAPLYFAGDIKGFKEKALKIKVLIQKKGIKTIVTNCPTCVKMMKKNYKKVGVDIGVNVIHISSFIKELIDKGALQFKNVANSTVTYHDPCILAKDLDIIEEPRAILKQIGYQIKEPIYTRKNVHCCGGKSKIGDEITRNKINKMRKEELEQTDADVYVSACPTCKDTLKELHIKDITEIVADALK